MAAMAAIWVGAGAGSTRAVLTRLGLVAMAGMGAAALRRQTLAEAPEASWPELAQGVRRRISAMRRARPVPAPEPEDRKLERLERLAALHERGALSDQEYEAEKAALLGRGRGEA